MDPITVQRFLGRVRGCAVVFAITVLSVGAVGPASAAAPSTAPGAPDPRPGALLLPVRPAIGPGLRAEFILDPSLGSGVGPSLEEDQAPDEIRAAPPADVTAARPAEAAPAAKAHRTASPTHERHGRNHLWSASLGLDRGVSWFSCSRSRPPDFMVYRWGCAGPNNIYLFAHAGGPFRRLHDLYVQGRLRKGMTVSYADAGGHVHRYSVAWWRVVLPTAGGFAYAGQARPSMTLQTCVGPHDRDRLIVRLYRDD